MRTIDKALLLVISAVTKAPEDIDYIQVVNAWRDYRKLWPDNSRAMSHFQKILLEQCIDEDQEKFVILFGQYMENLGWSFRKKNEQQ